MSYRSPLQLIVVPDETGRPNAMLYRVAFTQQQPWLAIVELRQCDTSFVNPVTSAAARDQVLNRLLDHDLRGLLLDVVRLVATDQTGSFEYAITPDIHDYMQRGNRYSASPERARRGRLVERIEIDSENLIAGRVRVDTVHAKATALAEEIKAALV
ncbi:MULTISPECIES: hypothetical protein [unclassified Paraburkholderia]|uniref:hypothetical protein n=1 Tax=unclassified Paraburkholderia TaxID=2615204 RepID=UPI002AB0CFEA|nr:MULTISPECIES: hypothetical protein [unclassified Paraburkholderia]